MILIVARSLAKGPADTSLSEWGMTLLGVFYVAWSLSHLLLIRDLRPGRARDHLSAFCHDLGGGYGRLFGRAAAGDGTPSPSRSVPKKPGKARWRALSRPLASPRFFSRRLLRAAAAARRSGRSGSVIGILAFLSDLGESLLKRGAGIKDSSQLLPGTAAFSTALIRFS